MFYNWFLSIFLHNYCKLSLRGPAGCSPTHFVVIKIKFRFTWVEGKLCEKVKKSINILSKTVVNSYWIKICMTQTNHLKSIVENIKKLFHLQCNVFREDLTQFSGCVVILQIMLTQRKLPVIFLGDRNLILCFFKKVIFLK